MNYFLLVLVALSTISWDVTDSATIHECVPLNACTQHEDNITALVFGDFNGGDQVSGRLFVGRNAILARLNVGQSLAQSQGKADHIVVGNDVLFSSGSSDKGNVVYGGVAQIDTLVTGTMGYNGILHKPERFDFHQSESCYYRTCNRLANHDVTSQNVTKEGDTLRMVGHSKSTEIFEVSCEDLSSSTNVIIDTNPGCNILVRVTGSDECSLRDLKMQMFDSRLVLWDFCDVSTLRLDNFAFDGSLFAPKSVVYSEKVKYSGNIVAAEWKGKAKMTATAAFQGCMGVGTPTVEAIATVSVTDAAVQLQVHPEDELFLDESSSSALDTTRPVELLEQGTAQKVIKQHKARVMQSEPEPEHVTATDSSENSSGTLFLEASTGSLFLQESTGDLFLEASTGDLFLEASTGDLFLEASTGDLFLEASTGDLFLEASTGDLFLETVEF